MSEPLIPLGTVIDPWGEVAAVGYVGERYYWLVKDGVVSMLPESALNLHVFGEAAAREAGKGEA